MALVTQTDLEAHTGYINTDFKQAGSVMTSNQWVVYVSVVTSAAESIVNRYCARKSFEVVSYTEYHSGRGPSGEGGRTYRELDRVFIPVEQPVTTLTSVYEDVNPTGSVESWTLRTARSTIVAGDYQVIVKENLTKIRFHNNVPKLGLSNLKLTYSSGYLPTDQPYGAAKLAALELCANVLARKKRDQQAQVAARVPTVTGADMFQMQRPDIFTQEIRDLLAPYRRMSMGWNQ
jgi:hypothetical protein